MMRGLTGGMSTIWWRQGFGSSPKSGSAHEPQWLGFTIFVSSTSLGGAGLRWAPLCPGWPPRLRPVCFFQALLAQGASVDGGLLEVRDVFGLRALRRSTSPLSFSTTFRRALKLACQRHARWAIGVGFKLCRHSCVIGRVAVKLARYPRERLPKADSNGTGNP